MAGRKFCLCNGCVAGKVLCCAGASRSHGDEYFLPGPPTQMCTHIGSLCTPSVFPFPQLFYKLFLPEANFLLSAVANVHRHFLFSLSLKFPSIDIKSNNLEDYFTYFSALSRMCVSKKNKKWTHSLWLSEAKFLLFLFFSSVFTQQSFFFLVVKNATWADGSINTRNAVPAWSWCNSALGFCHRRSAS